MIDPLLNNHPLLHAYKEFEAADCAYRKMVEIGIRDFAAYELAWREFLRRSERVWVKTQAAVHHMSGWQKIESEVSILRRSDPLLQYLQQARNVEEHSIQELAMEWDTKLTATSAYGGVQLSWAPWDRPLLAVQNRGVTYAPPRTHLGQSIESLLGKGKAEPRVVAELALRFYCDFLNRVSLEVVGNNRND